MYSLRQSGVGKTTLVRLMARTAARSMFEINAVSANVSQIRDITDEAAGSKNASGKTAIAFVDEIYHLNSRQQNVLLPAGSVAISFSSEPRPKTPGSR